MAMHAGPATASSSAAAAASTSSGTGGAVRRFRRFDTASSSAAAAATGGAVRRFRRFDIKDQCDEFFMYTYKVELCSSNRSHDWIKCPYAHPEEVVCRRDPRKYFYSGIVCPEFRERKECPRGLCCGYAHGVFEFWLHPTRYRTRWCKFGNACRRHVCFFAHTFEQLRQVSLPRLPQLRLA